MTAPERPAAPIDLADVFDRVSDGIIAVDADWVLTFANAAGARSTGVRADEVVGRSLWEVFPGLADTTFGRWFRACFDQQVAAETEDYYEPRDAWFSVRTFPSPDGLTIYFRDVTAVRRLADEHERARRAEREAHAARARFESLVEASSDFIAIAGLDGRVLYLNPGGRRLVGISADADVTTTAIADYLTPEALRFSTEVGQATVRREGSCSGQSTLRDLRGGPPIPVTVSSFLMRDPDTGAPFALATVQRDVRELVAAGERLAALAAQRRALLDRLVAAQEDERARIAADVHDDSVQALAAVDLRLGVLRRRVAEAAPDLVDQVAQVQGVVSAATERLRNLLFELEPAEADRPLVGALSDAAAHVLEPTGIVWSVDAPGDPDLPPVERVVALRVAKEALANARDHAGATAVRVVVRAVGDGVEVSVGDDGAGLGADATAPRPGHRGLQTMRDRVDVAGGTLQLETPPGGGTTVRFWLPCERHDDPGPR